MQNSLEDDHIPLLDDLIVPGKATKRSRDDAEQTQTNENSGAPPANAVQQRPPTGDTTKTAFEAAIEAMVTEILDRHMETARKEIIRGVLTEVRARLTGGSKPKQPEALTKK